MTCHNPLVLYAPEVSPGNPNITPPSTSVPILTTETTIALTWPYISPSLTLTLRVPELANTETFKSLRVAQKTRNGVIKLFRNPIWPKFTGLKYKIIAIPDNQVPNIRSFIASSLGTEIGLLDYLNRQWRGYLINPNSQIVHAGRNCEYQWEIEFQGVLV